MKKKKLNVRLKKSISLSYLKESNKYYIIFKGFSNFEIYNYIIIHDIRTLEIHEKKNKTYVEISEVDFLSLSM